MMEPSTDCSVIIGRNPKEANSNTSEIQQQGNPVAYTGNCFTLWPILGIPIHTCKNLIPMVVTRAMANSSKNHALLMCRI